jgi:hypothetical protein
VRNLDTGDRSHELAAAKIKDKNLMSALRRHKKPATFFIDPQVIESPLHVSRHRETGNRLQRRLRICKTKREGHDDKGEAKL